MKLEATLNASPNPENLQEEMGAVCPNIDAKGRQRRLMFGIFQLGLAVVILAVLMLTGVDRLWRLPLFFVFMSATVGYFQWRDKTCVAFAQQGVFELNGGIEKMDEVRLRQVRRQANRVMLKAFLVAIPLTLLAFILPA